jgi:hypothetical protein
MPAQPIRRPVRRLRPFLLLAPLLAGCGALPTECLKDREFGVDPDQRTLSVGQSYTPRAYSSACDGEWVDPLYGSWSAEDPAVVRVDPESGRTTALRAGSTRVVFVGPDTLVAVPLYGAVTVR